MVKTKIENRGGNKKPSSFLEQIGRSGRDIMQINAGVENASISK